MRRHIRTGLPFATTRTPRRPQKSRPCRSTVVLDALHDGIVVCQHCREKIEWKKKYRKYKPLTVPAKCVKCGNRTVKAAYHQLCDDCARVPYSLLLSPLAGPRVRHVHDSLE